MRTDIPVSPVEHHDSEINYQDADIVNGNQFFNDGKVALVIRNNRGGNVTVRLHIHALVDSSLPVYDRTEVIPAGNNYCFSSLPPTLYNDPDNFVWVDFSAPCRVATVSIA
jgi:hypothetical protein